jgi:spore germination cell wall hydrolase CwlJ-like protein
MTRGCPPAELPHDAFAFQHLPMHQMTSPPVATAALPMPIRMRVILTLIALASIALPLAIVLLRPEVRALQPVAVGPRASVRVIPKAELPPVEPTAFAAVSRDDAKAHNATIPFSSAPLLPARPFRITGDTDSVARATDCLAAGVLYEAGDDPVGQRAVAQVILNRVRHPAFPKSVCGVVFQGAERSTGCQFTFTCDGALTRRYSAAAWQRASALAKDALTGRVEKKVGTATHYHTDWVVPYWSASLDKVSEVNTHLFFRWTGWWGTPPAFRGRYTSAEPLVPKLAGIGPAHAAAAGMASEGEAAIGVLNAAAVPDSDMPQPMPGDANAFLVTLDRRVPSAEYDAYALRICGERPYCKLLGWTERADTPPTLPTTDATMERMAFSFLRDRSRAFEKALWNCDRFDRPATTQCMRRQVLVPPARAAANDAAAKSGEPLTGVRRRSGTLAPPAPAPAEKLPAPKTEAGTG